MTSKMNITNDKRSSTTRRGKTNCSKTNQAIGGSEPSEQQVPEGGWGWVVVGSVFFIAVIIARGLPVFFVEWMQYFDASATEVSWAVSLPAAITGIFSPVGGALCQKFGSRKIVLLGSVLNTTGYLLACFSQRVVHLYLTIGLLAPFGTALQFAPALVMLGHYFKKRYVLANSIALSGFSVNQMLVPRLAQYLIEVYGWRGAMLILTALGAHAFPCAVLLRPRSKPRTSNRKNVIKVVSGETKIRHEDTYDNVEVCVDDVILQTRDITTSTTSLNQFDPPAKRNKSGADYSYATKGTNGSATKYTDGSVCNNNVTFGRKLSNSPFFSLFKSLSFITLLCGCMCGGVAFFVTVAHLVARAWHAGIAKNDAAVLMTGLGVGSLAGRTGHGILIDKNLIQRDIMFIGAFVISAVINFLNPLLDTFSTLCVFAVIFGVSNGTVSSLMFAMIRLQVTDEQAPLALAFGTLVFAVSGMAGGVLAGLLFDKTGNYDISFCFAGAMLTAGSVLILVHILLTRRRTEDRI
ncbi:monocarboxylate transporter 13-like [Amphiura filiformis]|uniref:monocarboxylate transporter 13-like n=1 Tax=Amphiura filiformis TaxID=82378 RepID=UPI003B22044B